VVIATLSEAAGSFCWFSTGKIPWQFPSTVRHGPAGFVVRLAKVDRVYATG